MSTNINLGIDNEKTKEILKLFLNGQAEPAAFDNLVFTGVDVPAYSENEPVVIKVEIKGTVKASLFLRLRDGVEKETGRRTEFKFIIVPGVVDAAMVKEFWPFFSEKTGNTRAWVEMAEPDFKGEKLVVACRGTAHFERIAEAAPRLERCFREFFGVGAVFEPKRAPDDDAAAHRLVSTKYEKADEGENFKSEILTNEEIKGAAVPVESIISAGRYVVEGRIFFDKDFIREIKNRQQEKSYRLSLYITDEKDTLKLFTFASEGDGFISRASSMENARALIDVKFDEREGEITGRLRKIKKLDIDKKRDTAPVKRVELHAHTQMSAMDSIMSVGEYIKTAVRWGHSAAAITDHGVVHAFPEAYNILKKIKDKAGKGGGAEAGLKLIFGVEGYLVERAEKETKAKKPKGEKRKTEKPFHVILLAKNAAGLKNLYKLISLSHIDYFYRKPRIPRKELEAHREGLIVGSACYQGELYQAMLGGAGAEALEKTASFYDYLEIQPVENNRFLIKSGRVKDDECLREHNKTIVELGKKTGKPVAATCDIHFLRKEDRVFREVLMSAQGYDDIDDGGTAVLDFKTTDEMLKEFEYLGAEAAEEVVVKNPRYIASLIEDGLKPVPDKPYPPRIEGADEAIREIIYKNARRIYGDRLNEVIEARIEKELSAIIGNGFAALYYLAKKMVDKSNEDGYIVGSRGSVGSS
ncbi:MAG TPA: PHP domain-containing protein, partial [bacterium]|nr:PHP domain-containing protein [bacterium]